MKENIQQLFAYIVLFIIIFIPNPLFAEDVTMTAVGEYVMGDNDTYTEAKKLALQDAKRILLEEVGTYIESKTEVKDGIVKNDEIKQYTAGIVKVEEVSDERSVLANKASVVKVNVKAIVDPDAIIKQVISFRNRKDVEESAKKTSAENDKLRKEIEQLNQQLRNVTDEKKYQQLNSQRKEILEQIDTNEKGLTLLLSGEGLYTAALLDRQKKDEGKEKVKQFIKEIASVYKLSASTPEVDDNGDGTANVRFEVEALIPFTSDAPSDYDYRLVRGSYTRFPVANVIAIDGVNLINLSSTGLKILYISKKYPAANDFWIPCEQGKKCQETEKFMNSEIASLTVFVKLGIFEKKEALGKVDTEFYAHIYHHIKKEYNIKMSLSEIKSLSQLKLKVLYDSQEYGQ